MYTPSTKPNSRIDVADVLRGIAIGGIVLIHFIEQLNFYRFPEPSSPFMEWFNQAVWDTTFYLLAGKMYAIFSMLFGLSFFIQHDNQAQRGVDFRPRFVWRMVLFFMFGLFNTHFYNGDILCIYAVCGVLIIPFIRANDKVVTAVAIALMLQPLEIYYIVKGLIDPTTQIFTLNSREIFNEFIATQGEGSWLDVASLGMRKGLQLNFYWALEHGRLIQTVFLFLFGIMLGRKRMFYDEGNNVQIWKRVVVGALCAFAVLAPAYELLPEMVEIPCVSKSLATMLKMWRNLSMMLIIVGGVVVLFYRTKAHDVLMKIAPYGKMSLTNYLGQAIVGCFIFYHWGLGFYRFTGHAAALLLGAVVVVAQWYFCRWWLQSHSHGPFESLWRQLTWINSKKE
ncbi:MAG: DUF418 domain-containing protein [Alistipes sp.]|nr:DUF418 domain-containing protein [Alistipes sp.]